MPEITYDTSSNSLLDHSIKKWERLSRISYGDFSKRIHLLNLQKTCALCYAYIEDDCVNCPVTEIACRDYCLDTPVEKIVSLIREYTEERSCIYTTDAHSQFQELALKEVIFLQRVKQNASEKRVRAAKVLIEVADKHMKNWKEGIE